MGHLHRQRRPAAGGGRDGHLATHLRDPGTHPAQTESLALSAAGSNAVVRHRKPDSCIRRRQFDRDRTCVCVLADVRESLLRGAQQDHIAGHALRGQVLCDAHGHGGVGLGRKPIALPLDRGGQ